MSNYTIDSSFAKEASTLDIDSFGVIPEGEYVGKFTEIENKEFSTASGFSLKFSISEGQQAGMITNLFIPLKASNEKALSYSKLNLKKLFLAAGFSSVGTDLGAVLNKQMRVKIKHRKSGDKTYVSIDNIFESLIASGRAAPSAPVENKTQAFSPANNNEDIPF